MNINQLCNEFNVEPLAVKELTKGLINNSFIVIGADKKRYLLQEINTKVFKDVDAVMSNIVAVTNHIRNKYRNNHEDTSTCTLNCLRTSTNDSYIMFIDENGQSHHFRMFDFIENANTYDSADEHLLYECGVGFGKFQKDLADFPASRLYDTIPNFHNTKARYIYFKNLIHRLQAENHPTQIFEAYPEILFANNYGEKYANVIIGALESGKIPLRVVHNDTKLNNIMIDNFTHKAVCAVDLDTVMPGSMLFDYGDAIRYSANTGAEDDANLNNVGVDLAKFKSFTTGYLSQIADCVTDEELKLMSKAPAVIAYELGLRFLTDYLEGNHYFKCDPTRPKHNLERARAQFKLMREFEKLEPTMQQIIEDSYSRACEENCN